MRKLFSWLFRIDRAAYRRAVLFLHALPDYGRPDRRWLCCSSIGFIWSDGATRVKVIIMSNTLGFYVQDMRGSSPLIFLDGAIQDLADYVSWFVHSEGVGLGIDQKPVGRKVKVTVCRD